MSRAYFDASFKAFSATDPDAVLGILAAHSAFGAEPRQRGAWKYEIEHLRAVVAQFSSGHLFLEFTIPRMGRRVDAILLCDGIIFVLEYKGGEAEYPRSAIDQTVGYSL